MEWNETKLPPSGRRPRSITGQAFEELPEFLAVRTYVRCTDRLFQSLPAEVQWRLFKPVILAAVDMGSGIAGMHGDAEPPRRFSAEDREASRARALKGIRRSREHVDEIARVPGADGAELLVARDLLDRIEGSVRETVLPGSAQA